MILGSPIWGNPQVPIMQLRTLPRTLSIASLSCKGTRIAVRLSTANFPKWYSRFSEVFSHFSKDCMRTQKFPVNQTKQIWNPMSRNVIDKCESVFLQFWMRFYHHCSFGSWSMVYKQTARNQPEDFKGNMVTPQYLSISQNTCPKIKPTSNCELKPSSPLCLHKAYPSQICSKWNL
jgi:hypothetical protein